MKIIKLKNYKIVLLIIFCLGQLTFLTVPIIQAGELWDLQEGKDEIPTAFGYSTGQEPTDIRTVIVRVVRVFLTFIALIFVIIIIYAGWKWMTAAGNQDRVAEAKRQIIAGAIGFFIIAAAYALTFFVIYIMEKQIFNTFSM